MKKPTETEKRSTDSDQRLYENLKRAFDDKANEPIPQRLTDLLDQLKSGQSGKGGSDSDK